jgi:hypothetical protein
MRPYFMLSQGLAILYCTIGSICNLAKTVVMYLDICTKVAKALVEKVLASPTQKTQLVEAKEVPY